MSVPIFGSEIVAAQLSVLKNLAKRGRKRTHDRGREGGGAGKMFWHPTCISCVWGPRAGNIFLDVVFGVHAQVIFFWTIAKVNPSLVTTPPNQLAT